MPYISTEALVGGALLVVLALGYQYIQPTSSTTSTNTKSKKKNKKKSKVVSDGEPEHHVKKDDKKDKPKREEIVASKAVQPKDQPKEQRSNTPSTPKEPEVQSQPQQQQKRKTLAEKIAPQPRKTKVDDMLAPEDLPAKHARVMRIVDPSTSTPPPSQPVPAAPSDSSESSNNVKVDKYAEDYASSDEDSTAGSTDDGGWNVVAAKPKKPISLSLSATAAQAAASSTALPVSTKIQKKNAKKAEAKKAARAAEEADRQRRLAMHRRDLERERINEIYLSNKKKAGPNGSKSTAGATLDSKGKLIWD